MVLLLTWLAVSGRVCVGVCVCMGVCVSCLPTRFGLSANHSAGLSTAALPSLKHTALPGWSGGFEWRKEEERMEKKIVTVKGISESEITQRDFSVCINLFTRWIESHGQRCIPRRSYFSYKACQCIKPVVRF